MRSNVARHLLMPLAAALGLAILPTMATLGVGQTTVATPLNNAASSLASDHLVGVTTLVLKEGEGARFGTPTPDAPVRVTVARRPTLVSGRIESTTTQTIYLATGRTGDTLTGLTAVEGTTDRAYYKGDPVAALITAGTIAEIHTALATAEDTVAEAADLAMTAAASVAGKADDAAVLHKAGVETVSGKKTHTDTLTVNPSASSSHGYLVKFPDTPTGHGFYATDKDNNPLYVVDYSGGGGFVKVGYANFLSYVTLDATGVNANITLNRFSTTFSNNLSFHTAGVPKWRLRTIDATENLQVANLSQGSAAMAFSGTASGNNLGIFSDASAMNNALGVIHIGNRSSLPTANPPSGGYLYYDAGTLTSRNQNGVISKIAPFSPDPLVILAVGDSITAGQGLNFADIPANVLAVRLGQLLEGRTVTVINKGVSGSSWEGWAPGGANDVAAQAAGAAAGAKVVQIMLGTNDVQTDANVQPSAILTAATSVVNAWVGRGYKVILHSSPAVVPGSQGGRMTATSNDLLLAYQAVYASLADGINVFVGDTAAYPWFLANPSELSDGVHPAATGGHSLGNFWADAWYRYFARDGVVTGVDPVLPEAKIPNGGRAWSKENPNTLKVRTPAGVLRTVPLSWGLPGNLQIRRLAA